MLALNTKHKICFVDGSIKVSSEKIDEVGYSTWKSCNDLVLSWIVNTLNSEISDTVQNNSTPKKFGKIFRSVPHEVMSLVCLKLEVEMDIGAGRSILRIDSH